MKSKTALLLLILLVLPIAFSINVRQAQAIDPLGTNATLFFSTGFETVTISGDHLVNLGAQNYLETDGSYSANYWMEGYTKNTSDFTSHGGSRCFGMQRTGARTEIKLWHDWSWSLSNTWYIKLWQYFPSLFPLFSEGELIFSFGDSAYDDAYPSGYPWVGTYLFATIDPTIFQIQCAKSGFDNHYNGGTGPKLSFTMPLNQWSLWEFYLDRGTTDVSDGQLKVWVNNNLIIDSGKTLPCKASMNSGRTLEIYPTDLYNWGQGGIEQRWIDDLEIWDDIPTNEEILKCYADINCDGRIDALDWAALSSTYGLHKGETGYDARADITEDDFVDINDAYYIAQNVIDPATGHYGRQLW